jgi:gliding motility-associated-like protein
VRDGTGTPPFLYSVDSEKPGSFDSNPVKKDLSFGWHSFYVIDIFGCRSKAKDHEMLPPPIFIPEYFSPGNGDNINDTWLVGNLKEVYPDALVTIYDRFGKQLIQYKGDSDGWDGKYLGKDMPTTDYWYVIEIKEIGKQYVGHFTLMRR